MPKNLVIVESPAKAKTISSFLGGDFIVRSCYGHIRDLPKDDSAIDVRNNFTPKYEVDSDKKELVKELQKLSREVELVWLASDEDREGEAISWHLAEALNLDPKKTRRIVFHEITKSAITKAIQNPRTIDNNLVDAQQARRVLDRLVGFELSPVLWKKVRPSLSAGRVQSVAVRLIVEREREVQEFETAGSFHVTGFFDTQAKNGRFKAKLERKFDTPDQAETFLNTCSPATFTVKDVQTKPGKKSPSAPFTTSTLQQEASRKLGFPITKTMLLAQKLYEAGFITYMRTDSVNLSEEALQSAASAVQSKYGKEYAQRRTYQTKSAGAQEAHEAIRPTDFSRQQVDLDRDAQRLYDLVWKRSIASQMADAKLEKTVAHIAVSTSPLEFVAEGEVITFDGFLTVYTESNDDDDAADDTADDGTLPALSAGQKVALEKIVAQERFTRPPARYTEASLVKKLEELGIGRPSTYAPTISTIQKRNYVVREDREGKPREIRILTLERGQIRKDLKTETQGAEKAKMFPTDIGIVVTDFLKEHFPDILDYHFTATVEKEFDEIALGKLSWTQMLQGFYEPFHKDVEKTIGSAERHSGERVLGTDPATNKQVSVRLARYGAVAQIGTADDPDKKFASLATGQTLESITLEEALNLFKLPRKVGLFEGQEMVVGAGRFGPYVKHAGKFYSLKKEHDPMSISEDEAVLLIIDKRNADANKYIASFDSDPPVKVIRGRYGPYISVGKDNIKIPAGVNPEELTLQQCLDIAAAQKDAPAKSKAKAPAETAATAEPKAKKAAPKTKEKTSQTAAKNKRSSK